MPQDGTPPDEDFLDLDWDKLDEDEETETGSPEAQGDDPAQAQAGAEEDAGEEEEAQPEPETPQAHAPEERAEEQVQRVPFGFKADGKQVDVPGAETHVYPDGRRYHVIPDDSFNRVVRHHLADRNAFRSREMEYARQIEELKAASDPEQNATVQAAKKAMSFIETLLGEPIETDENAGIRVLEQLAKWKAQYPVWKAEQERDAEKQRAEAILAARDRADLPPDEYEREQQVQQMDQKLNEGMTAFLQSALQAEDYKGLSQEDLDDLVAEAWENRYRYVGTADQDVPELGIQKGQPYYDFRPMLGSLQRAVMRSQRVRQYVEGVKSQFQPQIETVAQVARQNAAALQSRKPAAAGVKPRGERAATAAAKAGVPKWDEFREDFMNADLLNDDE